MLQIQVHPWQPLSHQLCDRKEKNIIVNEVMHKLEMQHPTCVHEEGIGVTRVK